jgi:hypothetical protein
MRDFRQKCAHRMHIATVCALLVAVRQCLKNHGEISEVDPAP